MGFVEPGDIVQPLALVVDPDAAVRAVIRDLLEERAMIGHGAASAADAIEQLKTRSIALLVLDPDAPGGDRQDVLRHALSLQSPPLVLLVRSGPRDDRDAEWTAAGVFDVVSKPLDEDVARLAFDRALRQLELIAEFRRLRRELQSREGYHRIVGRSVSMDRVRAGLERFAATDDPVLIHGPEGSGKELVARNLHLASRRETGPFVVLPCSTLTHAPDMWRGRDGQPGALSTADGGTVYLDDLTAMPIPIQESLVAAIGSEDLADLRLLASAPMPAAEATRSGRLIEELAQHFESAVLPVAGLQERAEDIPLLARHFARTIAEINHLPPIRFAPEAMASLESYAWPGNVRELRQAIEHASILAADGTIRNRDLPERVRDGLQRPTQSVLPSPSSTRRFREAKREVVESFELRYLRELLQRHSGNVTAAAAQAGMLRSALQRLLRKYALKSSDYRGASAR